MYSARHATVTAALATSIVTAAFAPANALQIFRSDSFSFAGSTVASAGFQEFDPALGTLDRVSVEIIGSFFTALFVNPGQALTPIVDLDVTQIGPRGFSFDGSARFTFAPVSDPGPPISGGHSEPVDTGFTFDFAFTNLTDLVGFDVPSATASNAAVAPPIDAAAQRSDFIALFPPGPIGINEMLQLTPFNFVTTAGFTGGGTIFITYDYTPPPRQVPAPPAAPLLALGLAGLGVMRRRRAA